MSSDGQAILTARNLGKIYGSKLVLKKVSFSVLKGQIVLVAGNNGAGKSTLVKILAGLADKSAGEVELDLAQEEVGYLGHDTFLYEQLSALDNLRFWSDIYGLGLDENGLMEILSQVGLEKSAHERAGAFSRGMAQRLSLARVFMPEPKLVFLDEPGTGLDWIFQDVMREKIVQAKESGAAVIWVSHNVRRDMELCDRLLVLSKKTLEFFGTPNLYAWEGAVC